MPKVSNGVNGGPDGSKDEPVLIKFHRHRYAKWAVLFDSDLEFRTLEELHDWAARKIAFVVIDTETGEDITRILLA